MTDLAHDVPALLQGIASQTKSPFRQVVGAVKSIDQNMHRDALPDFRNLGVILRIVLIVLGLSLFVAIADAGNWQSVVYWFLEISAPAMPALVLSLALLWILSPSLRRLHYRTGMLVAVLIEIVLVTVV